MSNFDQRRQAIRFRVSRSSDEHWMLDKLFTQYARPVLRGRGRTNDSFWRRQYTGSYCRRYGNVSDYFIVDQQISTFAYKLTLNLTSRNSGACAAGVLRYPTRGTFTAQSYSFIRDATCDNSSDAPDYMSCPTKAPTVPTNAPSVPATPAPVVPATPAPIQPTQTPVAPTSSPIAPTTVPDAATPSPDARPPACSARGVSCVESTECCSGRCMMNECQASYGGSTLQRSSLRGPGRGGAAGESINVGQGNVGMPLGFGFGFGN